MVPKFAEKSSYTRRHFLHLAGSLTLAGACGHKLLEAAQLTPAPQPGNTPSPRMQLGILLGTFPQRTLEGKLDAAKAAGLECVQLGMDCAGLPAMPDVIEPELATRIREQVAARGLTIASLQGTFNMSHPDPEHRRMGLQRLRVLAHNCARMGANKIIHLCTGTRDTTSMWRRHPDNNSAEAWRDMAECVRQASRICWEAGVIMAFEPEVNNVVDSAKKARRLLDEIGSPYLKVTIDPANIFHTGELPRMAEMLEEAFALLGKDIALAHAKDLDHDGDAGHLPAGKGKLDYDLYLKLLQKHNFKGPLLLHGLSQGQVPECVSFLREKLARLAPTR